jgi:hypothetical protein
VIAKARELGAPIPVGEQSSETPDFLITTAQGTIGIELAEVFRPASRGGLERVRAANVQAEIVRIAEERYSQRDVAPLRMQVYFTNDERIDKRQMAYALVDCVIAHPDRTGVVTLAGQQVPKGIFTDRVLEGRVVVLAQHRIRCHIGQPNLRSDRDSITKKHQRVPTYRANFRVARHPTPALR